VRHLIAATVILLNLGSLALSQPLDEGIRILSDSLKIRDQTGVVQFEGNVLVKISGASMTCDQLTVHTSKEDASKVLSGTAIGRVVVVMEREEDRVEAEEARFDLETATVELVGSPRLFRGKTTIQAERIVYLLEEGTATFHGSVRAVFTAAGE
jgi:lipopolysaccharide transport protein LptA